MVKVLDDAFMLRRQRDERIVVTFGDDRMMAGGRRRMIEMHRFSLRN